MTFGGGRESLCRNGPVLLPPPWNMLAAAGSRFRLAATDGTWFSKTCVGPHSYRYSMRCLVPPFPPLESRVAVAFHGLLVGESLLRKNFKVQ